jgi:3'-phosphoadenosine 5'-phosphosulfate sulfotransferase (PAPS reductase)/FAD synthetase
MREKEEGTHRDIICWWSGGVTSAVACHLAIFHYGAHRCRILFLDTMNEHKDTYRFMKDCEKWYGLPIEVLVSDEYDSIQETWYKHLSLNVATGAICSFKLKRRVREKWEKDNKYTHQVFGFEFNKKEINRAKALSLNHPQTLPIFPLIEWEKDKGDAIRMLAEAGILIPEAYSLGFNNNNCLNTGCVQGGIGYWKKIQKEMPDLFDEMAKVEHELTALKGEPVTMLKDQSNSAKDSGVQLVFLKKHSAHPGHKCIDDMKGREVLPLNECMGLCGTNDLDPTPNSTQQEINFTGDVR